MTVVENLNDLEQKVASAKEALVTNLTAKGVSNITTANTLTELSDSVTTIPSGGGGGNQPFDFASIGYTGEEEPIKSSLDYAKKIKDEWNPTQTDLTNKFNGDNNLIYFPLVDTTMVKYMGGLFYNCKNLTTIPPLVTSNCASMRDLFYNCQSLKEVPQLDSSKCKEMQRMFMNCYSITTIPTFDNSVNTNMARMFSWCQSIKTIPQLDCSKCKNMNSLFNHCDAITTIPALNSSLCTDMGGIFEHCLKLSEIRQIDVKSVRSSFSYSFGKSYEKLDKLRYLSILNLGTQDVITSIGIYAPLWGIDGDGITNCRQSLIDSLITNSFDRATAGYSTFTITLDQATKALLTEDEIAQITAKGFTLA